MKKLIACISILITVKGYSQTVSWSPEIITPKETTSTWLSFPQNSSNNYYVIETVKQGRKLRDYISVIDRQTLQPIKKVQPCQRFDDGDRELRAGSEFVFHNKNYSFNIDENQKNIFDVYSLIQDIDGNNPGALTPIQKIDASKLSALPKDERKSFGSFYASQYVKFQPAYDKSCILSALVNEHVDKNYSMLTITEWDENLKEKRSNKYKIAFAETSLYRSRACVQSIVKDGNGFYYVLVRSVNPEDKDDNSRYWIYQFKQADPAFSKVYKKEFGKNMSMVQADLFQDASGKVYACNIGMEIEKNEDKDDIYHVNSAVIAGFDQNGTFQVYQSGRLANEMMYYFVGQKQVDKKGNVNSLRIKNILPTAEGGIYVIWEHQWTEYGNHWNVAHYDNALVQYYNSSKKLQWQKPVFKQQSNRESTDEIYAGIYSVLINNNLCLIYPDDIKNADKPVNDYDIASFSVVKFGNKDLAGMFVSNFTPAGDYSRKYIKWPDDKSGYGLCINSFVKTGENEFIASLRKIRQGAIFLTAEGYTFLKLAF